VQTWYARMVHLLSHYRLHRDEEGTSARTLERDMAHLWTFVVEEGVEPTNNREERALRFAVLWRRMMQDTYNEKGDRWVDRPLAVRETCRLRGRPTFPALVHAVMCDFNGQHPDISWIEWIYPPEHLRRGNARTLGLAAVREDRDIRRRRAGTRCPPAL
jgi:transposase